MKDQGSVMYDRSVVPVEGGAVDTVAGPDVPVSDVDQRALRFWQQMSLAAAPVGAPQPAPMPVPGELRGVLGLFEASAEGSLHGGPSAPSAGALYPYEHYAVVGDPLAPAVYAVDATRRTCRLLHRGASVARALADGGLELPERSGALVLIAIRPWLSMRKYDDRGYLYAQLDTAHLGTHLLCLAARGHRRAEWLTRAATGPLAGLLRLGERHAFAHSVLLLGDPVDEEPTLARPWSCADWRGMPFGTRPAGSSEERCWRALAPYLPSPPTRPAAARHRALLSGPEAGDGPRTTHHQEELTALAARRRSAKDFAAGELPVARLRQALARLGTPLTTDLADADGFGVTLVARDIAGLDQGAYSVQAGALVPRPTAAPALSGDDIVRICMGQEQLRHSSAAVVLHTRHADIFRRGMRGVDEALLRAGSLAQLLYLGATDAGMAVTTIGGFDAGRWHTLAGLPDEDEVLYVAMLGLPGTSTVKSDRLQPAHAHGQR
ncbi:hypothetical protein SUDANB180_06390 [Streptomyces sp. enrichment culture]